MANDVLLQLARIVTPWAQLHLHLHASFSPSIHPSLTMRQPSPDSMTPSPFLSAQKPMACWHTPANSDSAGDTGSRPALLALRVVACVAAQHGQHRTCGVSGCKRLILAPGCCL